MAIKNFILQGFTPKTHADAINRLLAVPDIQRVILSVAYINEDGVRLIEDSLKSIANKTKVFSGIRNDITSRQGLERLINLGVSVYVIDTGARGIIFHPKLYLAIGKESARLIIGSANLTLAGLNNNIEAGLALDLDLSNSADKSLVDSIETQISSLITRDKEHIWLITNKGLEKLQTSGRLLDETEALPPRPIVTTTTPLTDSISRIKLDVPQLYRTVHRAKTKLVVGKRQKITFSKEPLIKSSVATNLDLVWQGKLTERDLTIPKAKGTNPTGSVNLDRGLLQDEIDQRNYFRKIVFAHLKWIPKSETVEQTEAKFQLIIKGIYYGESMLRIAHTVTTDSPAYQQHNAMTRLSWGPLREYIAQRDYIGRTLSLYRDETNSKRFVLEID